jgi:hypothetical protein
VVSIADEAEARWRQRRDTERGDGGAAARHAAKAGAPAAVGAAGGARPHSRLPPVFAPRGGSGGSGGAPGPAPAPGPGVRGMAARYDAAHLGAVPVGDGVPGPYDVPAVAGAGWWPVQEQERQQGRQVQQQAQEQQQHHHQHQQPQHHQHQHRQPQVRGRRRPRASDSSLSGGSDSGADSDSVQLRAGERRGRQGEQPQQRQRQALTPAPAPATPPLPQQQQAAGQPAGLRPGAAQQGAGSGQAAAAASALGHDEPPQGPSLIEGFKQRLLTHIFLRLSRGRSSDAAASVPQFRARFNELLSLVIWSARLVGRHRLLLRLGPPLPGSLTDAASVASLREQPAFVALYDTRAARVLAFSTVGEVLAAAALACPSLLLGGCGGDPPPWERCGAAALAGASMASLWQARSGVGGGSGSGGGGGGSGAAQRAAEREVVLRKALLLLPSMCQVRGAGRLGPWVHPFSHGG